MSDSSEHISVPIRLSWLNETNSFHEMPLEQKEKEKKERKKEKKKFLEK